MSAVNVTLKNSSGQTSALQLDDVRDAERIAHFEKLTKRGDYESISVKAAGGKKSAAAKTAEESPYSGTVAELKDLIAERNGEREEDEQIVPAGNAKADLLAALVADDEQGRLENKFGNQE